MVTGGIGVSGAINGGAYILTSGTISTTNATASTTHTNGALVVTGGVGIGQDINVAGSYTGGSGGIFTVGPIRTTSTTASSSTTTGALRSGGGLGVVGDINAGGYMKAVGGLSTLSAQSPFIVQYGTTASATSGTVTFPVAFSATPVVTTGMLRNGTGSIYIPTVTASNFTWNCTNLSGTAAACQVMWHAFGPP